MLDKIEYLRKQLLYRSTHRGCKETDILLGDFAVKFIDNFSEHELLEYNRILEVNDIDLYNWIVGKEVIPEEFTTPLIKKLVEFNRHKYEK